MGRHSLFDLYLSRFQQYFFKYRTIPTMQECADVIGLASKASVYKFYNQMVERWYLTKNSSSYYPSDRLGTIPLFGSVTAGLAAPATDDVAEDVHLETYLIDNPTDTIMVSVSWDSMIEAWILDGDTLIVDRSLKHKVWDVIVAFIDMEYTVKYLEKNEGGYYLRAGNPKYADIHPTQDLQVYGVVTGSFRKYR